jgi:hypothetical protein
MFEMNNLYKETDSVAAYSFKSEVTSCSPAHHHKNCHSKERNIDKFI